MEKNNFAGYHDIKYMFASLDYVGISGEYVTTFHGRKNSDTGKKGELGIYAAALSGKVMNLAPEKRDGCAAVIMQIMEVAGGKRKTGINGEKLKLSDIKDFTVMGVPLITQSLFKGKEGRSFLWSFLDKKVSLGEITGGIVLQVNDRELFRQAQILKDAVEEMKKLTEEIRQTAEGIPLYMKGGTVFYHRIKLAANKTEKLENQLFLTAQFQEQVSESYRKWDLQES